MATNARAGTRAKSSFQVSLIGDSGHPPLLSQVHERGSGTETEQAGLELACVQDPKAIWTAA